MLAEQEEGAEEETRETTYTTYLLYTTLYCTLLYRVISIAHLWRFNHSWGHLESVVITNNAINN